VAGELWYRRRFRSEKFSFVSACRSACVPLGASAGFSAASENRALVPGKTYHGFRLRGWRAADKIFVRNLRDRNRKFRHGLCCGKASLRGYVERGGVSSPRAGRLFQYADDSVTIHFDECIGDFATIGTCRLLQRFGLTPNTRCRAKKGRTSVEILPCAPQ
jgi:hypothetical protein